MSALLDSLKDKLKADFGKTTQWQLLCKQRNAVSEDEQIRLAEEVLSLPPMGSIGHAWAASLQLRGAKQESAPPYDPEALAKYKQSHPRTSLTYIYRNEPVEKLTDVARRAADVASPFRPTVPLLAYWYRSEARLRHLMDAIQFPIPHLAVLQFEPTTSAGDTDLLKSHTDLMIETDQVRIAVEAKYAERSHPSTSKWLRASRTQNRAEMLDGWLRTLNAALGTKIGRADVADVDVHMVGQVVAASMAKGKRSAIVYQLFDPTEHAVLHQIGQAFVLANRLRDARPLTFVVQIIEMDKTPEFAELQKQWQRQHGKKDHLTEEVRRLMIRRRVAQFRERMGIVVMD